MYRARRLLNSAFSEHALSDLVMDFTRDFKSAQESISQALVHTTRSATQLAAEDLPFHRSLEPTTGTSIDEQSSRLLSIAQKLLRRSAAVSGGEKLELKTADAIDSRWRSIVDAADSLLERTDTCLDEYNGLVRQATPRDGTESPAQPQRTPRKQYAYHSTNLPKPQLLFDDKPQNTTAGPFKPFLTRKPHASVPLDKSVVLRTNESGSHQYLHPYATEISSYEYPSSVYTQSDPTIYEPFDTTTATWVDDMEGVQAMLQELKQAPLIAIDLEHHDSHSYVGIVSLMQISTRDRDWIVDTLKPWRRKLELLNEVFADPAILKVFHGAHMDIMWLQRDLGLYVVGLFDTHHASRVLGYPGGSLAYLLKRFVNFDAQKQYQMADWRMRPLPAEMFEYARSDTHFLLYVFDHMRNELVEKSNFDDYDKDKVQAVLERSKETSLQRYEYFVYDTDKGLGSQGWFNALHKAALALTKEQFAAYRAVHHWRDTVARQEDESQHQVMSKQAMHNVVATLPTDVPSLLSAAQPASPYIRIRTNELLQVVTDGIAGAADGPEMQELMSRIASEIGLYVPRRQKPAETTTDPARLQIPSDAPAEEGVRALGSSLWGDTLASLLPSIQHSPQLPELVSLQPPMPKAITDGGRPATMSNRLDSDPAPDVVLGKRQHADIDEGSEAALRPSDRESMTASAEMDPASGSAAAGSILKVQQKAERKAARAAHRRIHDVEDSANGATPFDYASAPSVLHAALGEGQSNSKSKKREAEFDPYKKAMDAPSGARKAVQPKAGKSFTFTK